MLAGRNSEDYYPITWVGRYPIYLTTALVAVQALCLVATALLMAFGGGDILASLTYSSESVLQNFTIWQFVTYAFVSNPIDAIWIVVGLYFLFVFGREVEKFLGRRAFIYLYLALMLAAPLVLTMAGAFGHHSFYQGASAIHFGIFIAFVVIYQSAEIFFGFQAKWVAVVLLAINSIQYLPGQQWAALSVLWVACGCAYGMMRLRGVSGFGTPFESWEVEREKPIRRKSTKRAKEVDEDPYASIDPLLDKISKQGIASLTKRERERLEQAREALLKREKKVS
jgi:membrane associated rhomboid family serine protease